VWWRHTVGSALPDGLFDYWTVLGEARADLEGVLGDWARTHLRGYTGLVNFETIGGGIIECHLRFADQWPDLYGAGWVRSVVGLYGAASGRSTTTSAARGTASCSSAGTAGATQSTTRWSRCSAGCPACRVSR
jgi:hypothetical protein